MCSCVWGTGRKFCLGSNLSVSCCGLIPEQPPGVDPTRPLGLGCQASGQPGTLPPDTVGALGRVTSRDAARPGSQVTGSGGCWLPCWGRPGTEASPQSQGHVPAPARPPPSSTSASPADILTVPRLQGSAAPGVPAHRTMSCSKLLSLRVLCDTARDREHTVLLEPDARKRIPGECPGERGQEGRESF